MAKRRKAKKKWLLYSALAGLLLAAACILYLDFTVRARFEGKRFALPARVYARPLDLFPGLKLSPAELTRRELALLDYREVPEPRGPGTCRCERRRPLTWSSARSCSGTGPRRPAGCASSSRPARSAR